MKIVFVIFFLAQVATCFAQQNSALPQAMTAQFAMDRMTDIDGLGRNDVLYGVPLPPGRVVGDVYYDKKWNIARVMLSNNDQIIEGIRVRYDLAESAIELKGKQSVKVLDVSKIKSVVWIDSLTQAKRYFVNGNQYQLEGVPLLGLLEVLADGRFPLLKRTMIVIKKATYNAAVDAGSRDTKIIKESTCYFVNGNDLRPAKSKKTLLAAFGEHADDMEKYIKVNKLNLNSERGLTLLFAYYNSKIESAN